jgi:hypothetical protein
MAAALLGLSAAGTALALPAGTVSVFNADGTPAGSTVCRFYFMFNPVAGGEDGAWELRNSSAVVVAAGDYHVTATEGDREPSVGSLSVPDGTYKLLWDDEATVDASRLELTVVVQCAATASPAPTGTPVVTAAPAPTGTATTGETPFQTVAAATNVAGGGVGGVVQQQPNTAAVGDAKPDTGGWLTILAFLAGVVGFVLVLTPRRGRLRR